ncbi:MAG TPA: hypothetical protein VE153_03465 [Myxococcus sp.]|nr:hypothetical protein [Myxococcus sp.]
MPAAVGALLMSGRGADERRVIPGFFLLALGTPAGALLGYSVAHTPAMVPAEGQASGTLRLMPAVGVTRDGIGLGLHGRF